MTCRCTAAGRFLDDIGLSLPYVETVMPYFGCEGTIMDEDNLLAEVRTEVSAQYSSFCVRVC